MSKQIMVTSTGVEIFPTTYRARLDTNNGVVEGRQRVLCSAIGDDGRYICGEQIAHVTVLSRARDRTLYGEPGWTFNEKGIWSPGGGARWRDARGLDPGNRTKKVTRSEGEYKGKRFHPAQELTKFLPLAAKCYDGHTNILEAGVLDVITVDDEFQHNRELGKIPR